jgi:hypothetical protein
MNKYMLVFSFFLVSKINFAQKKESSNFDIENLNVVVGKTFSNFIYKGPDGRFNTIGLSGNAYTVSVGIDLGKTEYLHWIRPGLQYYEVGARSVYNNVGTNWELKYLGVGVSYLYEAINVERFCFSPGFNLNLAYMARGQQTNGSLTYDLKKEKYFSFWNFQAGPILNSRMEINKRLSLFLEYGFAFGLNQIEKDPAEKTRIYAHFASLGFTYKF